jgi:uncharacterized tellurite resistance protein B-like protein
MSLLKFLGFGKEESGDPDLGSSGDTLATLRKIVGALEKMDPARARHVAGFAFILSRVAYADRVISEDETRAMEKAVMKWGHLPEEQALLVVQIAKNQNILFGGTDNFIVTRDYKEASTKEELTELLHCLFAVSAADDSISGEEESVISRIAKELGFTHKEQVAIRSMYRDKRSVMKDFPG